MRTLIIASAAILLVSLPALADRTRPYLGLNLQYNTPVGDFAGKDLSQNEGAANSAGGIEADAGLASRRMSAYIGVRGTKFDTDRINGWEGKWSVTRLVIGARAHLMAEPGQQILPTLGGGVTFGRTGLEQEDLYQSITTKDKSDPSIGIFLEGGLLARLGPNALLNADLQYNHFGAVFDFGDQYNSNDQKFNISFVTLQVGVIILFTP